MKKLISIAILFLSACTITPNINLPQKPAPAAACPPVIAPVVTQTKVQTVKIPDNMTNFPPMPPSIDLSTATQKDIALWVSNTEERLKMLEDQLNQVKALNHSE